MKKVVSIVLAVLLIVLCFAGCKPAEEYVQQPTLKYDTEYPATAFEYNLTMNKKIVPMLNILEGHISKAKDVCDGKYPIEYEIKSVEDDLKLVQDLFEETKRVYPPKDCSDRHSDILTQINRVVNSLEVYLDTLKATTDLSNTAQQQDIIDCAGVMESEFTGLKNMFNIS